MLLTVVKTVKFNCKKNKKKQFYKFSSNNTIRSSINLALIN